MGVTTRGVIITNEKDFWVLAERVGSALQTLVGKGFRELSMSERICDKGPYKMPKLNVGISLGISLGTFSFSFRYLGEDRILYVHTRCDSDLAGASSSFGEDPKGIILSLGYWGSSVEIMHHVLQHCSDLGECFIQESDTSNAAFKSVAPLAA